MCFYVLCQAGEANKWRSITYKYLSDESETETGLMKHTPIWRSKGIYITRLLVLTL